MLFDIFGKKTKKPDFVEKKEIKPKKYEQKNRLKDTEKEPNKNNPSFVVEHDIKEEVKPKNNDDTTEQSIAIGLDAKEDVKRSSKGFFNSRNEKKADAYRKFQT